MTDEPRPRGECGSKHLHLMSATRATCILSTDHRSPRHWGPDQTGRLVEWPAESPAT